MFCVLLSNCSTEYIALRVNLTADNCTFLQFHFQMEFELS